MIARTESEIINAILYKEDKNNDWEKILYINTNGIFFPRFEVSKPIFEISKREEFVDIFEEAEKSIDIIDEDGSDLWEQIEYLVEAETNLVCHIASQKPLNREKFLSAIDSVIEEIYHLITLLPE